MSNVWFQKSSMPKPSCFGKGGLFSSVLKTKPLKEKYDKNWNFQRERKILAQTAFLPQVCGFLN